MNGVIKTFGIGSKERGLLEEVAKELTEKSPSGCVYRVEETYFDFGQDWWWTTVIAHRKNGDSWQALSPRVQEEVLIGTSPEEVAIQWMLNMM